MSSEHEGDHELGHVQEFSIYLNVFLGLGALTVLTVVVSKVSWFDFGSWNILVAMVIASVKALLVAMFFMHLKYENPITIAYAAIPIVLLATLIGGIYIDNPLRCVPGEGENCTVLVSEDAESSADDHHEHSDGGHGDPHH